jgi:hypothetical protein
LNKCQANPVCSSGSTYNSSAKKCVINATIGSCPAGYTEQGNQCVKTTTYGASYGLDPECPYKCRKSGTNQSWYCNGSKWAPIDGHNCVENNTYICPDGGTASYNICTVTEIVPKPGPSCATGFTYDAALGMCVKAPACNNGGTFSAATNKCELTASTSCPSGFTYDAALGMCVKTPTCNNGGTFNASTNKCTISLTSSCPSGFTMAGSVCYRAAYCIPGTTINGTTNMCTMQATTNYTCPTGYVKINDDTCLKTVSCSDMPILEEYTRYEASLIYRLEPESFSPLINCTFGSYSCVDWRNTCVSKTPPPESCLRNENICWTYERNGTCQRKITNIYTECSYNITAQQIN